MTAKFEQIENQLIQKYSREWYSFIDRCEKLGWVILVTSSYRNFSFQHYLWKKNYKNAKPGYSMHNYGLALDLNAIKDGVFLKKKTPKEEWLESGIPGIAQEYNIRWGGNFSNYYDPIHFDMGNFITITELHELCEKQFGVNPSWYGSNEDINKKIKNIRGNRLEL